MTEMNEPLTKSYAALMIEQFAVLGILDSWISGHIKATRRPFRFVTPLTHFYSTMVVFPHLGAAKRLHNSQKNAKNVKIDTSEHQCLAKKQQLFNKITGIRRFITVLSLSALVLESVLVG